MRDERHTFFSRLGLEKNSDAYTRYYHHHPHTQALDDAFRGGDFKHALKLPRDVKQSVLDDIHQEDVWLTHAHHESVAYPVALTPKPIRTQALKTLLYNEGALDVMVVPLDKSDYYSHHGTVKESIHLNLNDLPIEPQYTHAILYATELDEKAIKQAPFVESLMETMRQYSNVAKMAFKLANILKDHGYKALAQHREYYELPLVPLAHKHHFGTVGMANHIIHPKFGNRIRLNAVLTTAPLDVDTRVKFDVRRFCNRCALCLMNCPTQAIKPHPRQNSEMQQFDEHRCFVMFQKGGTDCSLCITSCPFSFDLNESIVNTLKSDADIDQWLKSYLKQWGPKRRPSEPSTYKERFYGTKL